VNVLAPRSPDPRTALLVVDVQQGLVEANYGPRNNPGAERNIATLLAAWRAAGRPVLHLQHMSVEAGSFLPPELPGNALKPEALPLPGEPLFQKGVNSAFIGTGLEGHLRAQGITTLVLAGLTTDHCVASTARMAADLGFVVTVVSDATATFDREAPGGGMVAAEEIHRVTLATLHGEFATIRTMREVLV
jgi:nicotinamidase-related amidase